MMFIRQIIKSDKYSATTTIDRQTEYIVIY